jgi:hypothetical protein
MDELNKLIEAFASTLGEEKRKSFYEEIEKLGEFEAEDLISIIENYEEKTEIKEDAPELTSDFVEMLKQMIFNPTPDGNLVTPEQAAMNAGPKVGQEPSFVGSGSVAGAEDVEDEGDEDEVKQSQNAKAKVDQEASKLKENFEFDFSEDIQKIFEGSDFTEEFKSTAKTILEASVKAKAKEDIVSFKKSLSESVDEYLTEEINSLKESLEDSVDKYLTNIVEEWYEENRIALDNALKIEIAESLFEGIKNVVSENDVIIPENTENILESLQKENESVNEMYKHEVDKNIELTEKINILEKSLIMAELSEGMIDNDVEKFVSLCEEIEYTGIAKEEFVGKAKLVKEYVSKGFSKDSVKVGTSIISEDLDEETGIQEKVVNKDVQQVLEKLRKLV